MRYIIELSYNGASFHGWQIQPSASSVQETLSAALSTLLRTEIALTGAGRTDTGVNAIAYIAHFDAETIADAAALCYKLNAILPKSIVVHSIYEASEEFHARFDASKREYTYFLHRVKDPFLVNFSYLCQYPVLDFELMNKAASFLIGKHDFSCFEKTGADNKTSICTVSEAHWSSYEPCPAAWPSKSGNGEARYWKFTISADRFLRNMVRAVVGTLLEVGRGKRSIESFAELVGEVDNISCREGAGLSTDEIGSGVVEQGLVDGRVGTFEAASKEAAVIEKDGAGVGGKKQSMRSLAGESVPGEALFLTKVEY